MPHNIDIDHAIPNIKATTLENALEIISDTASQDLGISAHHICNQLVQNTATRNIFHGGGVAIPHIKLRGIDKKYVILTTLERSIDLGSYDDVPVDIICTLISPEKDGSVHLRELSRLSRAFKNTDLIVKLHECNDSQTMIALFNAPQGWLLAA